MGANSGMIFWSTLSIRHVKMALAALPLYGSVCLVCHLRTWDLGLDELGPWWTQHLRSTIPASLVASLQVGLQMSPPHTSLGAMGAARRWLIFFGDGCSCCSWRSHINVRSNRWSLFQAGFFEVALLDFFAASPASEVSNSSDSSVLCYFLQRHHRTPIRSIQLLFT